MRGRLMVAALLLALPLAGCIGDGEGGETLQDAADNDTSEFEVPEGRGPIVAFEETNETEEGVGGVDHDHDYWQGRDRVTILEATRTFGVGFPGERRATLKPDQGLLVFEATERVEVTVQNPRRGDVADPTGASAPTLSYKHAATADWIDVGPLAWGQPLIIQVTHPAQTDMPHATWSLWEFQLRSAEETARPLTFDVVVDIVRGDADIPLWPGHPAFYTDTHVRRVLEADVSTGENGIVGDAMPIHGDWDGPVTPEKVVSYGTRTLFVYVNITRFDVTNPVDEPTNFFLWHHNASGKWNVTNLFDTKNHSSDVMEHLWVLHVDENGMDSPYADGSRFGFELGAAFMRGAEGVLRVSCYGNCATWSADYRITVLATDLEVDPALYSNGARG